MAVRTGKVAVHSTMSQRVRFQPESTTFDTNDPIGAYAGLLAKPMRRVLPSEPEYHIHRTCPRTITVQTPSDAPSQLAPGPGARTGVTGERPQQGRCREVARPAWSQV